MCRDKMPVLYYHIILVDSYLLSVLLGMLEDTGRWCVWDVRDRSAASHALMSYSVTFITGICQVCSVISKLGIFSEHTEVQILYFLEYDHICCRCLFSKLVKTWNTYTNM